MISGKPVTSDTGVTGIPLSARKRYVPPVEINSTPCVTSPRANGSGIPLLETETRARRTFIGFLVSVVGLGVPGARSSGDQRRPAVVDPHPARPGVRPGD